LNINVCSWFANSSFDNGASTVYYCGDNCNKEPSVQSPGPPGPNSSLDLATAQFRFGQPITPPGTFGDLKGVGFKGVSVLVTDSQEFVIGNVTYFSYPIIGSHAPSGGGANYGALTFFEFDFVDSSESVVVSTMVSVDATPNTMRISVADTLF
jgi:hypothetical protein